MIAPAKKKTISTAIHILSTRGLSQSVLLQAAAAEIDIDIIPFTEIVPGAKREIKDHILRLAEEQILAIFTSKNSVQSVVAHLCGKPDWDIACLDGATRKEVITFFGEDRVRVTAPDAASLAQKIAGIPGRFKSVFFCGNRRLNHLPEALQASGKAWEEIVVYALRNLQVNMEKQYDGIMFFSPSAVDSFFTGNKLCEENILFAIGNTTARCIAKYTTNKIVVCHEHTEDAMINHIIAYFRNEK